MKKLFILLPLVLLLIAGCGKNNKPAATNLNNQISNSTANTTTTPKIQKFSDFIDYKNAYLISADTLSPEAQQALTGWQLTKFQTGSSTQINLKAMANNYLSQRYTLQPGQQLYFVNRNLGNNVNNKNNQPNYYAVIVDNRGYIVNIGNSLINPIKLLINSAP